MSQGSSHRVAQIVAPGSNPFEMAIGMELFGITRTELDVDWYDFVACSAGDGLTVREGLFTMHCPGTLDDVATADTVIAPNRPDPEAGYGDDVLEALRAAAARGARMVSFCTGAFALADAGLLDGHTVTTHWRWADQFRRRYPDIDLRPNVLFVDDGQVLTAAGSAAAIDLGLHIIRADFGASVATTVSRRLVFPAHREGGQQQFIERPVPRPGEATLAGAMEWATAHLDRPLTVAELAGRAAMSPSTFHRRFLAQTGTTPLRWLHHERIDHARALLETTALDVAEIARAAGFGTAANLRQHFRRHTGLAPTAYRAAHAVG
ncbi:helix-turn-helix domain-containing protein [Jiangella alba]|uniref:AraC family transcriptional regulator, transcriptional activator FtrA n=1 Tax=Jiangella alba TaxID=561176 RepID=A0A1H5PNK1_9ACTN|nr:helix-turn-helix domain-containing protein [Jiangella alba]SEF15400.1 AraC family transcriptional regulator, transcriptional activator FtrA [Jiangella alba]